MSYENPQRQVISTAPIFQKFQESISSTISDTANVIGKMWLKQQEDKKEQAKNKLNESKELWTKAATNAGKFGEASETAESNSSIPLDLSLITKDGKSVILDEGMKLTPGTDAKIVAESQQKMESVNAFPNKVVQTAAWFKADLDKYWDGMQNNNISSLTVEGGASDDDIKALATAASRNPNSVFYRMEKDDKWDPILIAEAKDENGNIIATGKYSYNKMKTAFESGGLVKLIPDVNVNLESTKKKASSVFDVKTTTGKDGKVITETDGAINPKFLDIDNAYLSIKSRTVTGSKTTKEVGIRVAKVNKEAIATDINFNAATEGIAAGISSNLDDAYSLNNDKLVDILGDDAALPKPKDIASFKYGELTGMEAWRKKFSDNWKQYTLATLPDEQPIKNEAGEFVTETIQAEKPVKPPKGGGGGKPTMDMKIASRNYRILTGQNKHEPIVDPLNKKIQYTYSADGKFRKQEYMSGVSGAPGMWVDAPDGPGNTYTNIKEFYNEHSDWFQKPALPTKK